MKLPRRAKLRTLAKWLGTVLTALLLVVWIGSGRFSLTRVSPVQGSPDSARFCGVSSGQVFLVRVNYSGEAPPTQVEWLFYAAARTHWKLWAKFSEPTRAIYAPLWMPLAVIGTVTIAIRRADTLARRSRTGLCRTCGYDLAATAPAAPCPECGKGRAT